MPIGFIPDTGILAFLTMSWVTCGLILIQNPEDAVQEQWRGENEEDEGDSSGDEALGFHGRNSGKYNGIQ